MVDRRGAASASGGAGVEAVIRRRLSQSAALHAGMARDSTLIQGVKDAATLLASIYRASGKVLFFGNGGSAGDAQHLAAELVGRFQLERQALPALALNVNTSSLTAIGNDYGYEFVFSRQIEALGQPGDVVIGISTSGNSKNVITGMRAARVRGLHTIALTGEGGGALQSEVAICLQVPSRDVARIQEGHILLGHILCELIEQSLFGPADVG